MTDAVRPASERDALVVARAHLRSATRLAERYGSERDVRHHLDAALAVIERALRAEDDMTEVPV